MTCGDNSFITGPEARIIARDNVTIFKEICAIQQAILAAISNCPGPGKYSTLVPQPIYAQPPQPINATGTSTIDTVSRTVVAGIVTVAGDGYDPLVPQNVIFNSPNGKTALLGTALTDGDAIVAITILDGGTGYAGGEAVTIDNLGSGGTGATAIVTMVSPAEGAVLAVTVTVGGTGYVTNGVGVIAAPPNTTALGTVTPDANGDILPGFTVTMTNPGASYTFDPTFVVENSLGPFPDNVTFEPVTPMTTTLDIDPVDGRPDSWMYYEVHVGQLDSPAIQDQLTFVLNYFTGLGYNIQIQVNPITMNTIQWSIRW